MDSIFITRTGQLFLILGILSQIFAVLTSLLKTDFLIYRFLNKSFPFMSNTVIISRCFLVFGVISVGIVALLDSDYILLVAQCLFFIFIYPFIFGKLLK